MSEKIKVKPTQWYTLTELVDMELFPWCGKDLRVYRRIILSDKRGRDHLKTVIIGKGRTTRYRMKGENIISFIAQVEDGSIQL